MSCHFYLSSAPADNSNDLQKFFEDLTSTIQARLVSTANEAEVGFFEPRGIANGHGWRPEVAEALRTSQTMVALISPQYFQSEQAGKEWRLFENRAQLIPGRGLVQTAGPIPSGIVPVIWIPGYNLPAKVSGPVQAVQGDSNRIYRQQGVLMLRRSLDRYRDDYVNVLLSLAEQIIETGRSINLPVLDVIPPLDDVDGAFNSSYVPASDPTDQPESGEKYKVVIVEDDNQVREMLGQFLSFNGFDCLSFDGAETALAHIRDQDNVPDVLLVDLELQHQKTQGFKLIEELAYPKYTFPIIAMSAGLSHSELIDALKSGADDVVAKPFDISQVLERIKHLTNIGQKRREYRRKKEKTPDDERDEDRPVFLSYSHKDRRTASILRTMIESRGIGVWYAPDILRPGDPVAERIFKGLERAQVFVPLVTDNYPRSPWCAFERFRWSQTNKTRVIFPVLEGVMDRIRNRDLIMPCETEYADITFDRFADGVTALLGRIQQAIDKNGKTRSKTR